MDGGWAAEPISSIPILLDIDRRQVSEEDLASLQPGRNDKTFHFRAGGMSVW
jgi:hypothetical protein